MLGAHLPWLKDYRPLVAKLLRIDDLGAPNRPLNEGSSVSSGKKVASTGAKYAFQSASVAHPLTSFWRRKAASVPFNVISEAASGAWHSVAPPPTSHTTQQQNGSTASAEPAVLEQRRSVLRPSLGSVSLPLPAAMSLDRLHVMFAISGGW